MALLPSELLTELRDPRAMRVRRNRIAAATVTEVPCPHCHVGVGDECLTFPRSKLAQFPHAKRLARRWAELDLPC